MIIINDDNNKYIYKLTHFSFDIYKKKIIKIKILINDTQKKICANKIMIIKLLNDMNAETLIEKRRNQLNYILNWTKLNFNNDERSVKANSCCLMGSGVAVNTVSDDNSNSTSRLLLTSSTRHILADSSLESTTATTRALAANKNDNAVSATSLLTTISATPFVFPASSSSSSSCSSSSSSSSSRPVSSVSLSPPIHHSSMKDQSTESIESTIKSTSESFKLSSPSDSAATAADNVVENQIMDQQQQPLHVSVDDADDDDDDEKTSEERRKEEDAKKNEDEKEVDAAKMSASMTSFNTNLYNNPTSSLHHISPVASLSPCSLDRSMASSIYDSLNEKVNKINLVNNQTNDNNDNDDNDKTTNKSEEEMKTKKLLKKRINVVVVDLNNKHISDNESVAADEEDSSVVNENLNNSTNEFKTIKVIKLEKKKRDQTNYNIE